MTLRGRILKGMLVLDPPMSLPDGCEVEVTVLQPQPSPPTWAEVFKDLIGKAEGLPSDSSVNHDHYLYGTPKK